jgi:hypothetical protein
MPENVMDEQKRPAIEWRKSPGGVLEVYANLSNIQWTLDDVRVRVAQLITSPDHPTPGPAFVAIAEERAAVTFSWRNVKLLRNQLSNIIESYEKVNGEIVTDIKLASPQDGATHS